MSYSFERPPGKSSGIIEDVDFLTHRKVRFLGSRSRVWHSYVEFIFLDQILTHNNFNVIIELGTGNGGMTVLFAIHALRMRIPLHTIDVRQEPGEPIYQRLKKMVPIHYYQQDVFSPEAGQKIVSLIKKGRVFLYCDNGDKAKEMKTYVPHLKSGDVVLAHDKNQDIYYKDICGLVVAEGLTPFHQEFADKLGAGLFSFTKS